jgi:hypothetical protein
MLRMRYNTFSQILVLVSLAMGLQVFAQSTGQRKVNDEIFVDPMGSTTAKIGQTVISIGEVLAGVLILRLPDGSISPAQDLLNKADQEYLAWLHAPTSEAARKQSLDALDDNIQKVAEKLNIADRKLKSAFEIELKGLQRTRLEVANRPLVEGVTDSTGALIESAEQVKNKFLNKAADHRSAIRTTMIERGLLNTKSGAKTVAGHLGIKAVKRVGGSLLIIDAAFRLYVWTNLDKDPTFSPALTYAFSKTRRTFGYDKALGDLSGSIPSDPSLEGTSAATPARPNIEGSQEDYAGAAQRAVDRLAAQTEKLLQNGARKPGEQAPVNNPTVPAPAPTPSTPVPPATAPEATKEEPTTQPVHTVEPLAPKSDDPELSDPDLGADADDLFAPESN